MKLGIMQPYFLPYIGYFSIIKQTDRWVVFDTVQYINKGWINRNRILSPSNDGISYITVPVIKKSSKMLIKDVLIDNSQNWKVKISGQLDYYKKKAPYYNETKNIVNDILNYKTDKISSLNIYALVKVCDYLDLDFNYRVFSEDTMGIDTVKLPDDWALNISNKLGADTYINPTGGINIFDKEKYINSGIDLKFLTMKFTPYPTFRREFNEGLSIIDVLMFNKIEQIHKMLDNYELL